MRIDQTAAAFNFFHDIFKSEFLRLRSLNLSRVYKCFASELAKDGFYYSGLDKTKGTPRYHISCFFCNYEVGYLERQLKMFGILELIRIDHEAFKRGGCSKDGNETSTVNFKENEIFTIDRTSSNPFTILGTLPQRLQSGGDDPLLICPCCKKHLISIMFSPCGCVVLCQLCAKDLQTVKCPNCTADIYGCARVFIP